MKRLIPKMDNCATPIDSFFKTNYSSKTNAITIRFLSQGAYEAIKKALLDLYVFKFNKNCNGYEVQITEAGKKVVLSLYDNKTLFIQGNGCYVWKENVFDSLKNSLNDTSMDIDSPKNGSDDQLFKPTTPSKTPESPKRSPLTYLSQMINTIRHSKKNENQTVLKQPVRDTPTGRPDHEETLVKELFSSDNDQKGCKSNMCNKLKSKSTIDQGTNTLDEDLKTLKESEMCLRNQGNENK